METDPLMMRDTCSLDLAEKGGMEQKEIGEHMGFSRQRVAQIEKAAMAKFLNNWREMVGDSELPEQLGPHFMDDETWPVERRSKGIG